MSMTVTIYHNPRCSTSRAALAMIEAAGHEPRVVNYLETGWTKALLKRLGKASGKGVRGLLRTKEALVDELGLKDATEAEVLSAMVAHPILVERPIVESEKGVVLGRPVEDVERVL